METNLAEVNVGRVNSSSTKDLGAEFLSHRHWLMAFIHGLVRNPSVAEDIFQEVWVRFADASARGIVIENKGAWCRGVARNLIFHYWRGRKGELFVGDPDLLSYAELAFEETERGKEMALQRRECLANCLQLLPERSRTLLKLKYYAGLSAKAIGQSIQRSPESVLMALSRVRRVMARCIETRMKTAAEL